MITKEHFITPVLGVTYPTWGILPPHGVSYPHMGYLTPTWGILPPHGVTKCTLGVKLFI
jgi:hypothetical protein